MNKSLPFFSVVIPTFNRKTFLKKSVSSVLGQSFKDFELIIVDDGSNDGTDAFVRSLNDFRVCYLKQNNYGVAHARNQGIEQSKGKYVAFLDSDDWWHTDKLKVFYQVIDQHPQIKVFHSKEEWYRCGKIIHQKDKHTNPSGDVYRDVLDVCCISASTVVIKKDVFDQVGLFDESMPACEDYDLWLRICHDFEIFLVDQVLTFKEGGRKDQLSALWGLDRYRVKALVKMLGSNKLSDEDYRLTLATLKKKAQVYINGARKRSRIEEVEHYKELMAKFSFPAKQL